MPSHVHVACTVGGVNDGDPLQKPAFGRLILEGKNWIPVLVTPLIVPATTADWPSLDQVQVRPADFDVMKPLDDDRREGVYRTLQPGEILVVSTASGPLNGVSVLRGTWSGYPDPEPTPEIIDTPLGDA